MSTLPAQKVQQAAAILDALAHGHLTTVPAVTTDANGKASLD